MAQTTIPNKQHHSIDWNLSVKLAGNKPDLAREMLSMFTSSLCDEIQTISESKKVCAMDDVLHRIHKLHGAASYCGVPSLKKILADCESLLKKKRFAEFNSHFQELELEANNVTTEVSTLLKST